MKKNKGKTKSLIKYVLCAHKHLSEFNQKPEKATTDEIKKNRSNNRKRR